MKWIIVLLLSLLSFTASAECADAGSGGLLKQSYTILSKRKSPSFEGLLVYVSYDL